MKMINNNQLKTLSILLREKQTTIENLAKELELHRRTVERNIEKLIMRGVPISTKKGRGGGVYIEEGYKVDKDIFTDGEIEELFLALHIANHILVTPYKTTIEQKMIRLNPKAREFIKEMTNDFYIDLLPEPIKVDYNLMLLIRKCIRTNCYVYIKLKKTYMKVFPINCVLKKEGLFLYAYNGEYLLILLNSIEDIVLGKTEPTINKKALIAFPDNNKVKMMT